MKNLGDLYVFLTLDYSQIEIRMLAEASKDVLLVKQLRVAGYDSAEAKIHGKDIHCQFGNTLTGWPIARIASDKETRRMVKEFHFSIIFGVSKTGLYKHLRAEGIKITQAQVNVFYDRYFQKYYGVARYIRHIRAAVERDGYAETLFRFRRRISALDNLRASYWGNQAVNTPIQGSAHQLILMALALLHLKPRTYRLLQDPILEVHDELAFRVRLRNLRSAYEQGLELLQQGVKKFAAKSFGYRFSVPLVAEAEAGFCLGSLVGYTGGLIEEFLDRWRDKHKEIAKGNAAEELVKTVLKARQLNITS